MMSRQFNMTLTVTELPHFRRLVDFVNDVETFARNVDDDQLIDMVTVLRTDLARLTHDWRPDA